MAATTSGALKAYIEGLGLSLAAYREKVPEDAALKYVLIHEGIVVSPRQSGDFGDMSASLEVTEEVQLDLYQPHRDLTAADRPIVESYTLPDTLARKLRGARITIASRRVYGVRLLSGPNRFPADEDDTNVVRHLYTVAVERSQ